MYVKSEARGSNPGGTCIAQTREKLFECYFKYCYGTKFQGASSFKASHQPVYEALTFQLVRELGLRTTDFYLLLNGNRSVNFHNWKNFMLHDPSGRELYFVSTILPYKKECSESRANELIGMASPYLDGILVADIVGKRQNYRCFPSDRFPSGEIIYLDLGCSFVYAKDGYLTLPHKSPPYESREYRAMLRRLSNYTILSSDMKEINLAELVENIPILKLPSLNPTSQISLDLLLSRDEIKEIQSYIGHSFMRNISTFRNKGILFSDRNF